MVGIIATCVFTVLVASYGHVTAQGFIFPDSSSRGCRTPNFERGRCITILQCDTIDQYIKKLKKNYNNSEIRKMLDPYICGKSSKYPDVCCPSNPIPVPEPEPENKLDLLPIEDCGTTANIDKIVNGKKAALYEFPWMAALMYESKSGPQFNCGGTLINKRYVLTAAHCLRVALKRLQKTLVQIRLGEYDFNTEEDCDNNPLGKTCAPPVQDFDVSIEDAIIHPRYDPRTLVNDIALIRLRRDADLSVVSVKPVCLPAVQITKRTTFKKNLTATGWGTTENNTYSPYLLKVVVPAVDNDKCSELYQGPVKITEDQLCAGGRNSQNTCTGDSGGPLMQQVPMSGILRTVQYGIVSAGPALCELKDFPVRYTRVTNYVDWILDNIRS